MMRGVCTFLLFAFVGVACGTRTPRMVQPHAAATSAADAGPSDSGAGAGADSSANDAQDVSSDGEVLPVLDRRIEQLFGKETKIYVRTPDDCEEWTLATDSFSDDKVLVRVRRTTAAFRRGRTKVRKWVRRTFDYHDGIVDDYTSIGEYEDEWDARSKTWVTKRGGAGVLACGSPNYPIVFDGATIVFAKYRWHLDRQACLADAPTRPMLALACHAKRTQSEVE